MTTGSVARDLLAAEYALGVLDAADRRRTLALYGRDRAFAREVDTWDQRLFELNEGLTPEPVPAAIWDGVQAELQLDEAPTRAVPHITPPVTAQWNRLFESLRFWRYCTLGAAAAAVAMASYILVLPAALTPQPGERYVAVLNSGPSEPAWLVTVDLVSRQLTIRPAVEASPEGQDGGKALELWLVADGSSAPHSLGLLKSGRENSLALPANWSASGSPAALAISLEPEGGSPTGLPTGPVVFQGSMMPLK